LLIDFFRILAHAQRDPQLDAATKTLDGTEALTVLPDGAGEIAASTAFALILNHVEENPGEASEWHAIAN
jgi:hypothetical protein